MRKKNPILLFTMAAWLTLVPIHLISAQPAAVTGLNVTLVNTDHTRWHVTAPGTWVEDGGNSANYFREIKRADNAVYMMDDSRHLEVQINLQNGRVWWAGGANHAGWTPLYRITHAEARRP